MSELIDVHCPYCSAAITGTRADIGEATTRHIDRCEAVPEPIRTMMSATATEDEPAAREAVSLGDADGRGGGRERLHWLARTDGQDAERAATADDPRVAAHAPRPRQQATRTGQPPKLGKHAQM